MMLMAKKRTYNDPLAAAMDWYLRITGTTADDLGRGIGYKHGKMVGHIRNGLSTGSEQKRRAIAEYFGYGYDEFLQIGQSIIDGTFNSITATTPSITMTSQATTEPPSRRKTDLEIHTEQIHHSVIGTFHNKELALKVNELLVDLEGLEGDDGLKAAIEWAKYKIHEAKKAKGGAGKTGTMGE